MANTRANDLGGFLRSRRERLTPEEAGIEPGYSRRRVPGLLFLDPHHRALYCDWQSKAQVTVAALHQAVARHPADHILERIVGRLAVDSPEFARMWARRPVRTCSYYVRELDHPVVGRVTLANETVTLTDDDQQLGLFYPRPGTSDADALTLLTQGLAPAPTGTRRETAR
ncbi:hypothetical protein [Nocardia carnea]|uniref:MmyB family transcriptional regulator n=1 Tax=Nocardia carnea TaxID=37328 RepID=UPI0024567FF3|nr:hypothetical protein [Nocardia carnea]